jgi:hypothetical protein
MFWRRSTEKQASHGDDSTSDRLSTLSRRVDELEGEARKLRGEWYDALDKLNRQAQRIAKRHERELAAIAPEEPPVNGHAPDAYDRILSIRRNRGG